MDLYLFISMLSVIYSRILCTVQSAPAAAETSAASAVHVRTKRCSCATFLDKECVYFCHLDIIWVNTPERVVSYGLGNAPRTKRALLDSMATSSTSGSGSSSSSSSSGHRCVCLRENDDTCRNFCRRRSDETSVDSVIRSAGGDACTETQCKHKLAADTGRIKRMKKKSSSSSSSSNKKQVSPPAFRIASKTRLLLEKWRARRRHRARAWEGESAAS